MADPIAVIIEDDRKLVDIFSLALEIAGFKTEAVTDGLAALDWLATNLPDVVVLDLHLPLVSGERILQKIRADERLAKTCVILATADVQLASELKAASDFILIKPISFFQLHNMVKGLRPLE